MPFITPWWCYLFLINISCSCQLILQCQVLFYRVEQKPPYSYLLSWFPFHPSTLRRSSHNMSVACLSCAIFLTMFNNSKLNYVSDVSMLVSLEHSSIKMALELPLLLNKVHNIPFLIGWGYPLYILRKSTVSSFGISSASCKRKISSGERPTIRGIPFLDMWVRIYLQKNRLNE